MQVGHHRLKTLAFFGKLLRDKGSRERGVGVGRESALESIRVEGGDDKKKKKDHEV